MMNMNVITIGYGCIGVRRVRRGVLERGNNQKGYLGVRVGTNIHVLCVCMVGKFPGYYAWDCGGE